MAIVSAPSVFQKFYTPIENSTADNHAQSVQHQTARTNNRCADPIRPHLPTIALTTATHCGLRFSLSGDEIRGKLAVAMLVATADAAAHTSARSQR